MTKGFDEWYKETGSLLPRRAYMAGAASRQAEINALSALGEMSEQKIDDLVLRNIELQKRIDFLEKVICENLDERFLSVDFKKGESND